MSECKQIELQAHSARSLAPCPARHPTAPSSFLSTHQSNMHTQTKRSQKVIQIAHCAGPNMIAITVGKSVVEQIWYNPRLSVDTLG